MLRISEAFHRYLNLWRTNPPKKLLWKSVSFSGNSAFQGKKNMGQITLEKDKSIPNMKIGTLVTKQYQSKSK